MKNEAAERLRNRLMAFIVDDDEWAVDSALLESALAVERVATVERIRDRLLHYGYDPIWQDMERILDEPAA